MSGIPVNVNGAWKETKPFVNRNGVWSEVEEASVNSSGTWKSAYKASGPMVLVFDADKGRTIQMPLQGAVNCTVDYGDGHVQTYTSPSKSYTHTYSSGGLYTVKITGQLSQFGAILYDPEKAGHVLVRYNLIRCLSFGSLGLNSLSTAFQKCYNLVEAPDELPSSVHDCMGMFNVAKSFNGDISGWDVSNVTNMAYMFASASSFSRNLSGWCVKNIVTEPHYFTDKDSGSFVSPIWGTCP